MAITPASAVPRLPPCPLARTLPSVQGEGKEAVPSRHHGTLIISCSLRKLAWDLPPCRLEAWMDNFAVTGHQRAPDELIVPVYFQSLLLLVGHGLEESEKVFGVEPGRIDSNFSGEIERPGNRHALVCHHLVGLGELAIAAPFGGEIDNYRARFHALHHRRCDEARRRAARDECCGNDDVLAFDVGGDQLPVSSGTPPTWVWHSRQRSAPL